MYGLQCSEQRYIHSDVLLRKSRESRDHSSRIGGFSLSAYIPKIWYGCNILNTPNYITFMLTKKQRLLGNCFFKLHWLICWLKRLIDWLREYGIYVNSKCSNANTNTRCSLINNWDISVRPGIELLVNIGVLFCKEICCYWRIRMMPSWHHWAFWEIQDGGKNCKH